QNCAGELGDDVRHQIFLLESTGDAQPDRNRGIDVTARDGANGVAHGEKCQPEGERDAQNPTPCRNVSGQHGGTDAAENQPERSQRFGGGSLEKARHGNPPTQMLRLRDGLASYNGMVRWLVVLGVTLLACQGPPTFAPPGGPSPALCGNGIVDPGEACDTALPAGTDGACPTDCSPTGPCKSSQLRSAGSCQARCETQALADCYGNGMLEQGEACDDGNGVDFDGCSSDCRIERALVMRTVTLLPGDQGCDLDGDGRIDNAFGGAVNT